MKKNIAGHLTKLVQRLNETPAEKEQGTAAKRKSGNTKKRISEKRKSAQLGSDKTLPEQAALEANPPHGKKGDFVKITVTLPPAVYTLISDEVVRRKLAKKPDAVMAAVIREI